VPRARRQASMRMNAGGLGARRSASMTQVRVLDPKASDSLERGLERQRSCRSWSARCRMRAWLRRQSPASTSAMVRWTWFLRPSRRSSLRRPASATTGSERRAREAVRLAVVVVLPMLPLPEVTTTTRRVGPDSSSVVWAPWWCALCAQLMAVSGGGEAGLGKVSELHEGKWRAKS
jgi:hypothetical protein